MNPFEEFVMHCLTANGETFVVPEFDVGEGWNRPDFVAIRPPKKKVYVVEVTSGTSLTGLARRVKNRSRQWFTHLRSHLESRRVIGKGWSIQVLVFVRADQIESFERRIAPVPNDVKVLALEDTITSWKWAANVWTAHYSFETDPLVIRS